MLLKFSNELKDYFMAVMSNEKMNGESVRMLCSEAEHVSPLLGREN